MAEQGKTYSGLGREVTLVYVGQLILVILLVKASALWGFGGALAALVGAVFIILPVIVLDRRGRPYERYGLKLSNPLLDLPLVLLAVLVTCAPIALGIHLFPGIWGVQEVAWQFSWPVGYVSIAAAHFLVVALPEEFFYRGYLQGRLDDLWSGRINLLGAQVGWGLVVASLLFAVGHFVVDFAPARLLVFFPSLVFGWLRIKRGSIVAPILYHACCNIFMDLFRAGYGL